MELTNKTKCLSAGSVFSCLTYIALTTFICDCWPDFVTWIWWNCSRLKSPTKATGYGEEEFLIIVEFIAPVMWLFMFLQRRRTRRTGWKRTAEQQSPLPHYRLPPSRPSHSTPVKVRNKPRNDGRGSFNKHFHSSLCHYQTLEHASECSPIYPHRLS